MKNTMKNTMNLQKTITQSTLLVLCLCLFPATLLAGGPPDKPILRVETGRHTAMIRRIDMDTKERLLVTGSDDKTVRLWNVQTGALLRTFRLPIATGNDGLVYAVAISPDGKTVAAGGWTGWDWDGKHSIYLFNTSTGQLVGRLAGLGNVINDLAFSPDGRWLAAGGAGGLRLYRKSGTTWDKADRDTDYDGDLYGLDFAPVQAGQKTRLVTSCLDGYLRLYTLDAKCLHLKTKRKAGGGKHLFGVAFSPDGTNIAVGYTDTTKITIHDRSNLAKRYAANTQGVDGRLASVAWSRDGRFLYGEGSYDDGTGIKPICQWDRQGKGKRQELGSGVSHTIMDIHSLKAGGVVYGSADPAWGRLDKHGRPTVYGPVIGDFRGMFMADSFRVSPDGRAIGFAYEYGGKDKSGFSVDDLALGIQTHTNPPKATDLELKDWEDTDHPTLNGKKLPLAQYEWSYSRAIASDGKSFLLGADWNLYSFTADGSLRWKQDIPATAWAVNIAEDNRLAVAAFGDGTIRWYRYSDGKLLLSFFPHKDKQRWIAWTPSGYYAASPGGDSLIGWHLNHGRDKAAEFFPASRFRKTFYRPDVVKNILITLDEDKALEKANAQNKKRHQQVAMEKLLPPTVTLLAPQSGSTFSSSEITLRYRIETPSGEPVTGIRAFVDGVAVARQRSAIRRKKGEARLVVPVPKHDCEIRLIAENRYSASNPAIVRLRWQGNKQATPSYLLPNLYVLAIGVGKYKDTSLMTLDFPGKDAADFARAMQQQKGKVYRDVKVRLLADDDATRDRIMDGFDWLEQETTSKDVAILFLAGHGENDRNGNYYFLPRDAKLSSLRRRGVSYSDIKDIITSLPGKKLFFVDTCFSGGVMGKRRSSGVDVAEIANDLAAVENGVVVFTSSTGKQYSLEDKAWNNGAFTKALVEGLKGKGDFTRDGKITINELNTYIAERVKKLTHGQQTPSMVLPEALPDFPIAVH